MENNLVKVENQKYELATGDQFIREYKVIDCLKKFKDVKTPAIALKCGAPILSIMKNSYGEDFVLAYIEMWLDNLNDFLNFNPDKKMKPGQIQETALLIYQEYHYMNLADITLVFTKIKRGEFGQLFESLDGTKVLRWFEDYCIERMNSAASESQSEGEKFKDNSIKRSSDLTDAKTAFKRARIHNQFFDNNTGAKK